MITAKDRLIVALDVPTLAEANALVTRLGDAVSFVSPDEQSDLAAIERAVGTRITRLPLPALADGAQGNRTSSRKSSVGRLSMSVPTMVPRGSIQ